MTIVARTAMKKQSKKQKKFVYFQKGISWRAKKKHEKHSVFCFGNENDAQLLINCAKASNCRIFGFYHKNFANLTVLFRYLMTSNEIFISEIFMLINTLKNFRANIGPMWNTHLLKIFIEILSKGFSVKKWNGKSSKGWFIWCWLYFSISLVYCQQQQHNVVDFYCRNRITCIFLTIKPKIVLNWLLNSGSFFWNYQ